MSGPFYGSLAASASVFVAILTALLVNNYVRVKSDRSQTESELNRIQEELEGLRDRRDDDEETIDTLVEKREADYREKAEKHVNEFIESEIPSEYIKPIEELSVDEFYQDLTEFHNCESSEELEHSPINLHHRWTKSRMRF
jgi:chromosome segregation ATPase